MSSLTAIFGSTAEKSHDSDKLLNLYWNRAELKKEFAGLRKAQFKLQDRIKQQEGATARLQQKLDHVEELLVDPQWAPNVLAFYQLRGLALRCQSKLARFAEQLKQQREQKQHNTILVSWNEQRASETRSLERMLLDKRDRLHLLEDQLQAERHRLMSTSGFLKIFRRRSVTAILDGLAEQIDAARQEEEQTQAALEEVKNRPPPDSQGLDLATKRSINLMIIAFAQQLYLHFAADGLATMAKEASDKSVGAINYGSKQDCVDLFDRIQKHVQAMEQCTDFAAVLQKRAKLLGEKATYRNDNEAVPVAESVTTIFTIDANGVVRQKEADILGENYWAVARILSR